ncbi:unnamed protein product [Gordionus sp. m RMFG-2023]|uniref:fimbrin-like n=1 Tax=Gordionus sp. m RMFG-2023 TaxID=3053472 RepID=UPI0030E2E381
MDKRLKHSVTAEEEAAYVNWINKLLKPDADLKFMMPLETGKFFPKLKDGLLLCKLVNTVQANTIDERTLNKREDKELSIFKKHENLNLAVNSARAIGVNTTNIHAEDFLKERAHLILSFLRQLIILGLFARLDLKSHPGLQVLLKPNEELSDFIKMSPEKILMRWVNYQLALAKCKRRMKNFTKDVQDCEIFSNLIRQIAPREVPITMDAMIEPNLTKRADIMLDQANKLGCRDFITSRDVSTGNYKLCLAFVANLFNNHPSLPIDVLEAPEEKIEETREEKTFRNWINSLGVMPRVKYLFPDLQDGIVLCGLLDKMQPKSVDWTKVKKTFKKATAKIDKRENCVQVVEVAKGFGVSLVGIGGADIYDMKKNAIMSLLYQLLHKQTMSILLKLKPGGKIQDKDIIQWAATKLKDNEKKRTFKSFTDPNLVDGIAILELLECIKPGRVSWGLVKGYTDSGVPDANISDEDRLSNIGYAISLSRKLGAVIIALPEDVLELKPKMMMTIFASLMTLDTITAENPPEVETEETGTRTSKRKSKKGTSSPIKKSPEAEEEEEEEEEEEVELDDEDVEEE